LKINVIVRRNSVILLSRKMQVYVIEARFQHSINEAGRLNKRGELLGKVYRRAQKISVYAKSLNMCISMSET
jgi:hypothetical protein